ncbi:MAG: peroxiredoxin [Deltaproteobacteria bacterium]|nr:peroxiredoxin [Nannocystaceae bacterium]
MIEIGQPAPRFERTAHEGTRVAVGDDNAGVLVLYFYPKDETAGCTAQACAFRDAFESFTDAGAQVVGVSDDSDNSHRKFAEHRRLPFPLIADEGGTLRTAFGIPNWLGVLRNRVTFVIDQGGVVRHVFQSQLRTGQHVRDALDIVRSLARQRGPTPPP